MFKSLKEAFPKAPSGLFYGVSVFDVDQDGEFEFFVCGFSGPNYVFKWKDGHLEAMSANPLSDVESQAIGACAADINGDGREELYILNTDTFAGLKQTPDRLFAFENGRWVDWLRRPENLGSLNFSAGRSVIAVDRKGEGQYGLLLANYGAPIRYYESTTAGKVQDFANEAGLDWSVGGRSGVSGVYQSGRMDIYLGNENASNTYFTLAAKGEYREVASDLGLEDAEEHARGVAVWDSEGSGRPSFVVANWEGPNRLFVDTRRGRFRDEATAEFAKPGRIRNVIVADFDNDGYEEIFFHCIGEPNRLFAKRNGKVVQIPIGDASEPEGYGTGAAICDIDQDGYLELLLVHGENERQPVTLFRAHKPADGDRRHYLRVMPLTRQGAPARGARVTLVDGQGRRQTRWIDSGSGYLCQMEPVAHFGLGSLSKVEKIEIDWPGGSRLEIVGPEVDQLLRVNHPLA